MMHMVSSHKSCEDEAKDDDSVLVSAHRAWGLFDLLGLLESPLPWEVLSVGALPPDLTWGQQKLPRSTFFFINFLSSSRCWVDFSVRAGSWPPRVLSPSRSKLPSCCFGHCHCLSPFMSH
jgi:hypothetical protein